jgi:hypothetical protein
MSRLALALLSSIAAAVLLLAAATMEPTAGIGVIEAPVVPVEPPAAVPLPAVEAFAETLERPLFSRGRRGTAVRLVQQAGPRLSLAGIAINGGRRIALVEVEGIKDLVSLVEGGQVQGWTVAQVLPGRIRLTRGAEAFEADLRPVKAVRPPPR